MTSLHLPRALLATWLTAAVAAAQTPEAPTTPAASKAPAESEAPNGAAVAEDATPPDATGNEGAPPEAEAGEEASEAASEAPESDEAAEKPASAGLDEVGPEPLGPPNPADQDPAPVFPEPEGRVLPKLELSFYGGASSRTPKGSRLDYRTAFAWGFRAGVYPSHWLALRAESRFAQIPVDVKPGGYDTARTQYPDTTFKQGNLDVFGLGFQVEPGPRFGRFRVYGILGAAWTRFIAPEPKTRGAQSVRSSERRGVGVDYRFGGGLSFEVVENWMTVSAEGTYGLITRQTGNAYDDVLQGIDDTGNIVHIAELPEFERSVDALLGIGLLL